MTAVTILILWLHVLVLIIALVVLAVPSWRHWLLSKNWSPIFLLIAGYGAFYGALLWPDSLGGWSVGLPLFLALFGALLVWLVVSFINEWRTDRASAVEALTFMIVFGGSAAAAEFFIGKDYWWLALGPLIGWVAIRWVMTRA